MVSVHDLLKEYIETGRIKLDKSIHEELTTLHDPCNYGRKSQKAFGHGYFEEPRWITQQCCENYVEMYPNRMNNYCCGAGGGVKTAFPELAQKISSLRVEDAERTGADILATSCPFCYQSLKASIGAKGSRLRMMDLMELVRLSCG